MTEKQQSFLASISSKQGEKSGLSPARWRSYLSTAFTVLLAATIIVAGFAAPSALSTTIDSEYDKVVVLASSEDDDVFSHVFEEPVSLYPWNLYNASDTFDITYAEHNVLVEQNVPGFLITTMSEYGMSAVQTQPSSVNSTYILYDSESLVNAFRFLLTNTETSQGCYVIYSLDINKDGVADLRCAVDQNGNIISLLFLSNPWVSVEGSSFFPESTGEASGADAEPSSLTDAATADGSVEAIEAQDSLAEDGTPAEEAKTERPPGISGSATAGDSPYALSLNNLERMPVGEELALWSYVHLIALSAAEAGQHKLAETAGFLDAGFTERYAHFNSANQAQPHEAEPSITQPPIGQTSPSQSPTAQPTISQPLLPTPTIFATEQYALYIYDLPTDVRFILYYDPTNTRCVGFNIQF